MGLKPLDPLVLPRDRRLRHRPRRILLHLRPSPEEACVRLVVPDGSIRFLNRLVVPLHLLCRSDALVIGFPVPAHLFRSALSFASLAACLGGLKRPTGGGPAPQIPRPIEIQRTLAGRLQVRLCEEYLERLGAGGRGGGGGGSTSWRSSPRTTSSWLVRCRSWKPKLEPSGREADEERRGGVAAAVFSDARAASSPTLRRRSGELGRGGCGGERGGCVGRARGGCVMRKDATRSGDRAWFCSERRERN